MRFSTSGFFTNQFPLVPEEQPIGAISNFYENSLRCRNFVFIASVHDTVEKRSNIVGAVVTGKNSRTPRINLSPVTTTPAIIKRRVTMAPAIIDRRLPLKLLENEGLKVFAAAEAIGFSTR